MRLHHRHRPLAEHSKRSTVTNVAVARELAGFLWAAMTHQPLRNQETPTPETTTRWGRAAGAARRRTLEYDYAIPTRDPRARQLTTGHCHAVPTRESQSDLPSLPSAPAARPQQHHHDHQQTTHPTAA